MTLARQAHTTSDQLTRKDDVLAHMAFAAATIKDANINVAGASLRCRLGFPDPETATSVVRLAIAPLPVPRPGTVVEVNYARGSSLYRYLTAIRSVRSHTRWTLESPRIIERAERRVADRVDVSNDPDYSLTISERDGQSRAVALRDLSTAGVSFEVPAGLPWARPGATVRGALSLAGGDVLPVHLAIRNRRGQGRGISMVLGAQLLEGETHQGRRIAMALARTSGR